MENVLFTQLSIPEIRQMFRQELETFFAENPPSPSPKETGKTVLDIEKFCEYTGLAKQTVYKKTGKGLIPHSKRGKRLYFDQEKVDAWLLEDSVRLLSEITTEADRYLNGPAAIQVNIALVRAFIMLRHYALTHSELAEKIAELEKKYDRQFSDVYEALGLLLEQKATQTDRDDRERIGYKPKKKQ